MMLKKPALIKPQKKIFSSTIIALLLLFAPEIQSQTLHVNKNSGDHSGVELNTIQKLTFSSGTLNVIRKSDEPKEFMLNKIRHLTFSDLSSGTEFTKNQKQDNQMIYPNPVDNKLNIRFSSADKELLQLKLISLDGKTIFVKEIILTDGNKEHQLDVSFLEQGLYFCQIRNNQFSTTKKFIKN